MPEGLFFLDKSKGEEDRAKVSEDSFSRLLQPPLLSLFPSRVVKELIYFARNLFSSGFKSVKDRTITRRWERYKLILFFSKYL